MGEVRTYLLDLKKMYCRPEKIIVPQTRICVLGFEGNPVKKNQNQGCRLKGRLTVHLVHTYDKKYALLMSIRLEFQR